MIPDTIFDLDVFGFFIGMFIMLESINEIRLMDRGDRACRVAKYVISAVSGLMLIWYALGGHIDWLHLSLASAAALFMWPHMVDRIYHLLGLNRRKASDRRERCRL